MIINYSLRGVVKEGKFFIIQVNLFTVKKKSIQKIEWIMLQNVSKKSLALVDFLVKDK